MKTDGFDARDIIVNYRPGNQRCSNCRGWLEYEAHTPSGKVLYYWCRSCDAPS